MMIGLIDTTQTIVMPPELRDLSVNDQARRLIETFVLPTLRQAHAACLVALDAWLGAPIIIDGSYRWALISEKPANNVDRDIDDPEDLRLWQERTIWWTSKLLAYGAEGSLPASWSAARRRPDCLEEGKALNDDWSKHTTAAWSCRDVVSITRAPRAFLDVIITELRAGIHGSLGMTYHYGISSDVKRYGVKRLKKDPSPKAVPNGTIKGESLRPCRDDPVRPSNRLIDAIIELDRCLREAHVQSSRVRTALSTNRPANKRQAAFVAWMLSHGKAVWHRDVRKWLRTHAATLGDSVGSGSLLSRFCEKQGAPASRKPWVLREEVRAAWLGRTWEHVVS